MSVKSGVVVWVLFGLILSGGVTAARAQQEAQQPAAEGEQEEPEYSFGTVKKVEADQIVISEFDYDTGEEKEITYWLDPSVELNGVDSLQQVAVGDEVDVDFVVKEGRNVAQALSVAKPTELEVEG